MLFTQAKLFYSALILLKRNVGRKNDVTRALADVDLVFATGLLP